MIQRFFLIAIVACLTPALSGCFFMQDSSGGGQADYEPPREVDTSAIALLEGYRIEAVATGLTFPTAVTFDDQNRPHVIEAGYSYGEVFTMPRLVRVEPDGSLTEIARGTTGKENNGPWTGVLFHNGAFYLAEGGVTEGGKILRITPDGTITPLIENLPTRGDHHTNGPAIGPDGKLYFGVGTATNSGVVGIDNYRFGWLPRFPDFHDMPAKDVTLAGRNYTTTNPLTSDPDDEVTTGAYVPFGTETEEGQVVPGATPGNGAVYRIPLDGGEPELVAWGLRNPFGLAFAPDGSLYVTENSFDVRGSRPVWGTGDVLWRIDPQAPPLWYGWPDYHAGRPLTDVDHYKAPDEPAPGFVLAEHPNDPPNPAAVLGVHASANGLTVSRSEAFGHVGQVFIADFGDMAPAVGKVLAPVGYNVVVVNPDTGVIDAFAVNRGEINGPASKLNTGGLERPIDVSFDNSGEALYIVDFGVMTMNGNTPQPRENTGVLWRITRTGTGGNTDANQEARQ